MVTRLVIDGDRVTGVEYTRPGRRHERVTAGEVVLCGGAFNSPQLLQVSGIGDAEHLRSVGVEVRHHLPGRRPSTCRTTSRSTSSTPARSRCR